MGNTLNNNHQNSYGEPAGSVALAQNLGQNSPSTAAGVPYAGQKWLVEERDACGVGLVANLDNSANHDIVAKALGALSCLEHRGGCSADSDSGDGAGILSQVPWEIIEAWLNEKNIPSVSRDNTGVGMVFLSPNPEIAAKSRQITETILAEQGLTFIGWREVPIKESVLGIQAKSTAPRLEQLICTSDKSGDELERQLYLTRRTIGLALEAKGIKWGDDYYICSFSQRTIVYKGMVRSSILSEFYLDLNNPSYKSSFAVYHRRFSTNTMPKWPLAQPMRFLGHNGEINTLLGNINWSIARQETLKTPVWGDRITTLQPLVSSANSDSANLDNVFEFMVHSGRSPQEALMLLVPEAYQNQPDLAKYPEIVDFYDYYAGIQEPWDGPALLVFSDGVRVGACLDRNGLRPARYCLTKDGLIMVSSEAGVVDIDESQITEKGRLGPGQMFLVDLQTGEVLKNWEVKERVAKSQPFGEWLQANQVKLSPQPPATQAVISREQLLRYQTAFGYTSEDLDMVILDMATSGKEPVFCMGDDIPLAVLSQRPHLLYDYFKQRFAQVTNPAIDPLREGMVMSLNVFLGRRENILEPRPESARLLKLESPVLSEADLDVISSQDKFPSQVLSTTYSIADGPAGLGAALNRLTAEAVAAVKAGKEILILSDRSITTDNKEEVYIPPMLAVGAVHHHLIKAQVRMRVSLIVDTAQVWSTHHFACLIGYGASAVCPYLTWETIRLWHGDERTQKLMANGKLANLTIAQLLKNYRKAVEGGLLKIMSKMGISLLSSYQGAQIFEAIGIGAELLNLAFVGTASRIGGLSVEELASEVMSFYSKAFPELLNAKKLENFGFVQYRPGGEYHMNSPEMAKALHKAVAAYKEGDTNNQNLYEVYHQILTERPITALRDLLDLNSDRAPIPLEEVESVTDIVKRFCTGGMSLGALSPEAHETLAIAMNRLGGKSNSGEGGEDPNRYNVVNDVDSQGHSPTFPHLKGLQNGDTACSAIKQVASGRFGVTPEYLMSGSQVEIKISQGAKPGEGGQLPGPKVSPYIAMLRRSKPGVMLISPPPHHDIYSIEDLAQLIFDLHQINPNAGVSVKLVAEVGIGTVAAGVAKANADIIQISGHDGGTGASPLSSIKHAGCPWELGLTEVHRVLLQNGLRSRVLLRVDGGFKTGWDVAIGALMGGEEFGFGSIAMIAEGCIMARICHTNNCPVGVATQQEHLRKRFSGTPGHVVNFFYFIAEEVRHILAHLGYRNLSEIIGRSDLLKVRENVNLAKTKSLQLDTLLHLPDVKTDRSWLEHESVHSNGPVLDDELLADSAISRAINDQIAIEKESSIVNTDRTVGARLAGEIAKRYGNNGWSGQITLNFQGAAGQSFGAFNLPGMTLNLTGEANDYVGKGMHGGEIVIKPPADLNLDSSANVIIGNTCLYGATGGVLYARGQAGERFAVRNSMAKAVIEGAGDHCCEYMTGGVIVVLGKTGRNVGAGQTGGLGYFLDEDGGFSDRVNKEIVKLQRVTSPAGELQLRELVQGHFDRTASPKAKLILDQWVDYLPKFWQVVPPSEADSPEANAQGNIKEAVLVS